MTAEIAVMNRIGVALAADSVVTVGRGPAKTYASADKLFQLSQSAPVGMMFYGKGDFLRVPWETIIKMYRNRIGDRAFPRLEEYASDFMRFIGAERKLFPDNEQRTFVRIIAMNFLSYLREKFVRSLRDRAATASSLDDAEIKRLLTRLVREELGETRREPKCDHLPPKIAEAFRNRYRNVIAGARREIFETLPISQLARCRLAELVSEVLVSKRLEESGLSSGVVVAGFGEREHYPALAQFTIYGMAGGRLLYSQERTRAVGGVSDGWLVPFAQTEMVATFMEGIDPRLKSMMDESTATLFERVSAIILERLKARHPRYARSLENKIGSTLSRLLGQFQEDMREACRHHFSGPVMEMVASLPKSELGAMAESLVNLTKFKRRVSKEEETVGGPIDVAVITKGDGFVWIKRKHYFPAELNPRFLARLSGRRT